MNNDKLVKQARDYHPSYLINIYDEEGEKAVLNRKVPQEQLPFITMLEHFSRQRGTSNKRI